MPIHDWTRVPSGLFHEFHQSWTVRIKDALNAGLMPDGYYALVEQRVEGPEPDVIAVELKRPVGPPPGHALATLAPPRAKVVDRLASEASHYARKANRITVRHALGDVVAVIEVVSPGNKDGRHALRSFVAKAVAFLRHGVHLLIVDLFPPSERDPQGIHKAIWDEMAEGTFALPSPRSRSLVSYQSDSDLTAYVEPIEVGEAMPDMPLFLDRDLYVPAPLEATYQATWDVCPGPIRDLVVPSPDMSPSFGDGP